LISTNNKLERYRLAIQRYRTLAAKQIVFIHINMKLIKRKDGSYSKRGLWDNIRANRGSGKEPTAAMLKQERKIKRAEKKRG